MDSIPICCGIFKGDILSPLLFIIRLFPLSTVLNLTKKGYRITSGGRKINHLLYLDDIKLYGGHTQSELEYLVQTLHIFSDKCLQIRRDFRSKNNAMKEALIKEYKLRVRKLNQCLCCSFNLVFRWNY